MTCIIGVLENGRVVMGADSAATSENLCSVRKDPKIFRKNDMLIGFAGSFRTGQVLRFDFSPPVLDYPIDDYAYLCSHFVNAMRSLLKERGCMGSDMDGMDDTGDTSILIGWHGRLYQIDQDFQVGEVVDKYETIGSGAQIARGALWAIFHSNPGSPAYEKIRYALSAAQYHCTTVREPFIYDEM